MGLKREIERKKEKLWRFFWFCPKPMQRGGKLAIFGEEEERKKG